MIIFQKIESYFIYGIYYVISIFILHNINILLVKLISEYTLFIALELGIILIQIDNFSLLFDYKELKEYYEKIINDEYHIKKLTNISNNLLKKYKNVENAYFKLLEIELYKYKSLYNIVETKISTIKSESIISNSSSLDSIKYNSNTLQGSSFDSIAKIIKPLNVINILSSKSQSFDSKSLKQVELLDMELIDFDKIIKTNPLELYNVCSTNII